MLPEIKVCLTMHEGSIATAPTPDELKALIVQEASLFVVERVVIPTQRVRAPEISPVMDDTAQFIAWLRATEQEVSFERLERLTKKLEELTG